jgi:hypothetical protein
LTVPAADATSLRKEATVEKSDFLARYGNWYKGDDESFAHCLILERGECVLLFQGLQVVTTKLVKAPAEEHAELVRLLKEPISPSWQKAAYSGYNFITNAEDAAAASEIAVYGTRPADGAGYYAAPADSEVARLVKAIARID